jgi:predicted Fe-Mo cluster-binding NifX family protein
LDLHASTVIYRDLQELQSYKECFEMKIAISSSGKDLDAMIDPRFGRCAYFVILDTDDMSFEAYENESAALGGGAGIQSAQFVASKGAQTVITGDCGPKAVQALSAAGVQIVTGQSGNMRKAIEEFRTGKLGSAPQ